MEDMVCTSYAILHKVNAVNTDSFGENYQALNTSSSTPLASMTHQLAILQAVPRKPKNYGSWPLAIRHLAVPRAQRRSSIPPKGINDSSW